MWCRDWEGRSQVEVGGAPSTLCPTSCAPSHLPVPGPQSSLLHCMGVGGGAADISLSGHFLPQRALARAGLTSVPGTRGTPCGEREEEPGMRGPRTACCDLGEAGAVYSDLGDPRGAGALD